MSDFEGYEYVQGTKYKYVPPVKTEEEENKKKIDASLEEIIYQNNHKNKKRTEDNRNVWHDDDDDDFDDGYRLRDDKRVHYVTLHLPRNEIQKICDSLNIDTKGYFVRMEAVMTKRHHK